jgi:phosphate transport system substrate-binding protein
MRAICKQLCAAALAVQVLALPNHAKAEVKVHGATTVAFGLLMPQQSRIEKLASAQLTIVPSSTSHGLMDLAEGRADIAMLAEALESIAASMNGKQPGLIDTANYVGTHVGNAYVQIIVHAINPIRKLTNVQLAGVFSGKFKNWQEIGGDNLRMLVVGEPTSTPHRLIKEALGIVYSPELRTVQNTHQTAVIVAQAPGAISYISTAHDLPVRDKLKFLDTDLKLPLALHLAARKDAPEHVKRVINAAAALGRY